MNTILVEDEPNNAERLQRLLEKHCTEIKVLAVAGSVEQAGRLIQQHKPQLVFLDIELPDGTGFEILKQHTGKPFHIIFTTAYDHYAIKAIKFGAADYLLKPIEKDELVNAVSRVLQLESNDPAAQLRFIQDAAGKKELTQLALPMQDGFRIVSLSDIIRCEADANYTRFYMAAGDKVLVSRTLKEYEELLADHHFCRVHHSHLINMRHAVKYHKGDGGTVTMSDNSEIEVSKRKKEHFLSMLPRS